jgi:hypothetical protein
MLPNSYFGKSIHTLLSCNIAFTTQIQSSVAKIIKLLTQSTQVPNLTKPKKRIQQIVGSFLYYAGAVNLTILMALSAVASQQAAPTEGTHNSNAKIQYCAPNMILNVNVHSDALCLSAPNAHSHSSGYFFLDSTL